MRGTRNFYWQRGIFARESEIAPFAFRGLALVWNVRRILASGEGKSRIPSGIEGWAGFLPPAIPAGLILPTPLERPAGVSLPLFAFSFEVHRRVAGFATARVEA